jgi:hypothetical protein
LEYLIWHLDANAFDNIVDLYLAINGYSTPIGGEKVVHSVSQAIRNVIYQSN